jgi:hypothetical protein
MTVVHVPEPQPNNPPIVTIKEYLLDPRAEFQLVGIHDGWRPLCVRSLEHALILVTIVDTGAPEEAEVLRLLLPGDDLGDLQQREGVELAFIGHTYDGRCLFLDVKPEPGEPIRRVGRVDLENPKSEG